MIKLTSLHVIGYKNFTDTEIDFIESEKYCAFIGLNASGKSNLLEVISKIFAELYTNKGLVFNYKYVLKYKINNFNIEVSNELGVAGFNFIVRDEEENELTNAVNNQYLPSKIVINYSGEELRLWEDVYQDFYNEYFRKNKTSNEIVPNIMNYINKLNWDMALISLLMIDDSYIKDIFNITPSTNIKIKFDFINPKRYKNYADTQVMKFVRSLNGREEFSILIELNNLIETIDIYGNNTKEKALNLFEFLYISYISIDTQVITNVEVLFDRIPTKQLSEGQKKLILIRFITHLLADENSLLLFDEPDSHIHVSRKEKLAELINESPAYSLLTTHSPALINFLDEKSVQLLKPHELKGIESIKIDKFMQIESIAENHLSLMDTSLIVSTKKHILMCEGVNDIKYIKKAIEVLSRTKDSKYLKLNDIVMMNCGGADNVKPVFEEIVKNNLKPSQKCVIIFDDDKTGRDNKDKIALIISSDTLTNVLTFTHPKINSANTGDFYMEDYFSVDAYKNDVIAKFTSGHNLQTLNQNVDVKQLINKNYENSEKFLDSHFDDFSVLLDKLLISFGL